MISGLVSSHSNCFLSQASHSPDPGKEFSSAQELVQSDMAIEADHPHSPSTNYLLKKFLHATPDVDRPMYRKDIYYTGSVAVLPQYHDDVGE